MSNYSWKKISSIKKKECYSKQSQFGVAHSSNMHTVSFMQINTGRRVMLHFYHRLKSTLGGWRDGRGVFQLRGHFRPVRMALLSAWIKIGNLRQR